MNVPTFWLYQIATFISSDVLFPWTIEYGRPKKTTDVKMLCYVSSLCHFAAKNDTHILIIHNLEGIKDFIQRENMIK